MDLEREPARITGGRGVLLRPQREGVDLLASQLVAIRHVLRGLDHLDVCVPGKE